MCVLEPGASYITDWAAGDPLCVARAQRLVQALGCPEPRVVTAAELADLARQHHWLTPGRTGALGHNISRDFVFNAFRWDTQETARDIAAHPPLAHWSLAGQGPWGYRDESGHQTGGVATVCQPAWELHSAWGCLHACQYCHVGRLVNIMLNLEALRDHLPELFALCPQQRLYKYDNQTDTLCFEPQYGASETFVPYFAHQDGRYLMLYTKSDNVEHLLHLPHGGHTLISWTLSPPRTCQTIELGAPSMEQRLAAARICQQAGYRVRFRFSPIVPLVTWREDLAYMIQRLTEQVSPDLITIDVLGWMRPHEMVAAMDVEAFDPRFRDEVYRALRAGEQKPGKHFFPHELRREVLDFTIRELRRVSPTTPVSLCNETRPMWEELGSQIGMCPEDYACCCGPDSVPGQRGLRP